MNEYIRDFYNQSSYFEADLFYTDKNSRQAVFGLSGAKELSFILNQGILYHDSKILTSLDASSKISLKICSDLNNTTIWSNNKPILNIEENADFKRVYCQSDGDFEFSENIQGVSPDLNLTFSGWNTTTGYFYLTHNGQYNLELNSVIAKDSLVQINSFDNLIGSGDTGTFSVTYSGGASFSGTGTFDFETNAGEYSLDLAFNYDKPFYPSYINLYFDETIQFPSGNSRFFIGNDYNQDLELEIFFNPVSGFDGSTPINANVPASGMFDIMVNDYITGSKNFFVNYSGPFTGIGGRLGNQTIETQSGATNISVFAEGLVIYNYNTRAVSSIMDELYYANISGVTSGVVGPGSGFYYFTDTVLGSGVTSAKNIDGETIFPTSGTIFTGTLGNYVSAEQYIDNYFYYINSTVSVSEGIPNYLDFWGLNYNDVDNGEINFFTEGYYDDSGYGQTGIKYRIPKNSRTSGVINFSSDYSSSFFQIMELRVTDFNSINKTIQSIIR